ncbi:MAG: sulfite exporter TauE/SafE family protein [Mailhella sp.]|nr:sulfite exporter TauE/SafE family protein [Mailhella sp.]
MSLSMIYVIVGWFLGGVTSGVAGFGGMMVALPILTLGIPPSQAVLVNCLVAAPRCTHLAWLYRKDVVWADMRWLWLGCLPGCVAGAYILKVVPVSYLQFAISLMIGVFVLLQKLREKSSWHLPDSTASLLITGMASGFANSSISVSGVPIGIFVMLKRWDKDRARAAMSMFFFLSGWVTLSSQWFMGLYMHELLSSALVGIIFSFLGQELGFRIGKHLKQKTFVRFMLIFLSCSAGLLFYKSLQ